MTKCGNRIRSCSILILIVLLAFFAAGCSKDRKKDYNKGSAASFVKKAAKDITLRKDAPDLLYNGGNELIDLDAEPLFQPYFAMLDVKASVDKEDKDLVHYSCRIPGLLNMVLNMTDKTCYSKVDEVSPWVSVEGTVRVVKDADGNRQIDVTEEDNAFAIYALLRYGTPVHYANRGIDASTEVTDENRAQVLGSCMGIGCVGYAKVLGEDPETYLRTVLAEETKKLKENPDILSHKGETGYGFWNHYYALPGFVRVLIECVLAILMIIGILALTLFVVYVWTSIDNRKLVKKNINYLYKSDEPRQRELKRLVKERRYKKAVYGYTQNIQKDAVRKLSCPQDRVVLEYLAQASGVRNEAIRKLSWPESRDVLVKAAQDGNAYAAESLPYPEERDILVKIALKSGWSTNLRMSALKKLPYPEEKEVITKIARSDKDEKLRLAALEMLPSEENAKALIDLFNNAHDVKEKAAALEKIQWSKTAGTFLEGLALHGEEDDLRKAAIEKLPYPACRKTLEKAARGDGSESCREAALKKLPWPGEKDILKDAALADESRNVRRFALEMLPWPDEREIFEQIAQKEEDVKLRRRALETLDPSLSSNVLESIVLNDKDSKNRRIALEKLQTNASVNILRKVVLEDTEAENRRLALKELVWPASREALVKAACHDADEENKRIAREKMPWMEEAEPWACLLTQPRFSIGGVQTGPSDDDLIKGAIALARHPLQSQEYMRKLCIRIQAGMYDGDNVPALSAAGWSAAALGRTLAQMMTPEEIPKNQERFQLAMDHHNELVDKMRELQKLLKPYEGRQLSSLLPMERDAVKETMRDMDQLQSELNRGLGCFMLDNDDLPLAYLLHILRDNQSRVHRFLKQGVIMGLVDWLSEHASHPEAGKLLEMVVAVRANLIRSDSQLTFFELRVPSDCSRKDYAMLLEDVLHCANPSVEFCNTKKLLETAEEAVPGCMEMLRVCPLRLIDPVNRQTLGFYQFKPYIHAMWTQYQPPLNTGRVISRYHEVDDRTKPLSSGLNLQLFRDPYAVIPTIFHEYQHFKGDPNEASVFLKTQLFSIGFYKKYPDADARRDGVFAQMTSMLGLPPAADKLQALNDIIEKCYGKQKTKEEAEAHAKEELGQLNMMIMATNTQQTWDRKITFPQFAEGQDEKNRDLIRDILIRFDTVPKSITEKEFNKICAAAAADAS